MSNSFCEHDSATTSCEQLQQPILVGYAFGPKKMATMGVVMAEASRAELSAASSIGKRPPKPSSLTKAALRNNRSNQEAIKTTTTTTTKTTTTTTATTYQKDEEQQNRILFSSGGLRNVVRIFRSSCSSLASNDHTASTSSVTTPMRAASTSSCVLRVSFVPLDLNEPIEEQHGGNFDILLHKMTEDILCLSTASSEWKTSTNDVVSTNATMRQALERIHRLNRYAKTHPQCALVDDPSCVQIVMSRSEISRKLQACLVGVQSASGMPVETPKFFVSTRRDKHHGLRYPLIVKPLTAAGTKKSHCMAIVLHESGLDRIDATTHPYLLQEYANHNGILFKVYVLGDTINVFSRPSLPNLPSAQLETMNAYVEFDSQRPYPQRSHFGMKDDNVDNVNNVNNVLDSLAELSPDEIAPVVDALKDAFGLELFGFDVLVSASRLLVVDVNYFPSYKEVPDFPVRLARYLTQRAIDRRNGCGDD